MELCGLITAAGLSTRMGSFKPLLPLGGSTVINRTVQSLKNGGVQTVIVVLGYRADEIKAVLPPDVVSIVNPDYHDSDMFASAKIGLSAMPFCDAFFLLPGDMPFISVRSLEMLKAAYGRADIIYPVTNAHRRHPPLINYPCIQHIMAYNGDKGMRGALKSLRSIDIEIDDPGCMVDLDTPEHYKNALEVFGYE